MKRFLSLLLIFTLVAAIGVPAMASSQEPIFNVKFTRVENTPTVAYDEWEIPYNVWTPVADNAPIVPGEPLTMMLTYSVPATVAGYNTESLSHIHFSTDLGMFDAVNLELVEAQGCQPKVNCDYETGICVPVPGEYANVELRSFNGCSLEVWAELGTEVKVVVRTTESAKLPSALKGSTTVTIGQCEFPAHFSIGIVDNLEEISEYDYVPDSGHYNVHWSDTILVQKRSVEFRPGKIFVALNNHYHRMESNGTAPTAFVPVDANFADCGAPVTAGNELFTTLSDIFSKVHDFFGIRYDQTVFTDADFFDGREHHIFEYPYAFGASSNSEPTAAPVDPTAAPVEPTAAPVDPTAAPVEPTAAPVEPTAAPVDPTAAPVEPTVAPAEPTISPTTPPAPPTGTISIAVLGAVTIFGGAIAAVSGRRRDS